MTKNKPRKVTRFVGDDGKDYPSYQAALAANSYSSKYKAFESLVREFTTYGQIETDTLLEQFPRIQELFAKSKH